MNQQIEEKWNWQDEFDKKFEEPEGAFGWSYFPKEQVISFIENLLEQERERMSDEVNKLLPKDWVEKSDKAKKEGDMYTGGFFMGMIDTVEKSLSIINK